MNYTPNEEQLCEAYQGQVASYSRALCEAEQIVQAVRRGEDVAAQLQNLATLAAEIGNREGGMGRWQGQWQEAGRQPGPRLAALLNQVAELLEKVLHCLAQAEQETTLRVKALVPELDLLARSRQMQQAYNTASDLPK